VNIDVNITAEPLLSIKIPTVEKKRWWKLCIIFT
jgi:hypothetical protein